MVIDVEKLRKDMLKWKLPDALCNKCLTKLKKREKK